MSSFELSQRLLRYPLDLTGTSPDNFIEAEVRDLPAGKNRAIVLSNGAYYTESLVVYDNITGERLTKKTQYVAVQLVEAATVRAGKEVCSVIVVIDPAVSNQVRVDYQAVGGPYILNVDALVEMINTLSLDDRPVTWGALIGKPTLFPPGHHLHDAGDVFGFEYLVLGMEEIRKAILMGDIASHDELRNYTTEVDNRLSQEIDDLLAVIDAHKTDINNPHATTKAQVGLGSVQNYGIASQVEAEEGTSNVKYMTPLRVKQAITIQAGALLQAHVSDTNNPHATTKAQVGLGSVDNYATATQAEAEAGTATNRFMTPLCVKQAITLQAVTPMNNHIGNTNNPHAVTKAQVALGSVDNFATATQAEAEAGTATNRFMTPLRVKEAITIQAGALLNAHVTNTSNPHSVTKAQVGLGSVDNYATATQAEAEAGTATNKFMTPLRVAQAITTQAGALLNSHVSNVNNPHAVTKAQVALGNVLNYGIATQEEAEAGTSNVKYMTPLTVKQAITAQAVTPLTNTINGHINRTDNPHSVTKTQVGLENVQNYGTVTDQATAINSAVANAYMTPQATRWAIDNQIGNFDSRYVRKGVAEDTSLSVYGGELYAWVNGGWRVIWPPKWQ